MMLNVKEQLKDALADIHVMSKNRETPFEKGLRSRITHFNIAAKKLKLEDMEIHYVEAQKLVDYIMRPESTYARNKFLKRIKKWNKRPINLGEEDLHLAIWQMGEQLEYTRHKLVEFPHLRLASYKATAAQNKNKPNTYSTRLSSLISIILRTLANIFFRRTEIPAKSPYLQGKKSKC